MNARIQLVLSLSLWLLAACGSPIVGSECKPGFLLCDGQCVDPQNDSANCGSCGNACDSLTCREAECILEHERDAGMDAGPTKPMTDAGMSQEDGGSSNGGTGAGDSGPIGSGKPFEPDGGLTFPDPVVEDAGCSIGATDCSGECADLTVDHAHCGVCGEACTPAQFCVMGECQDICEEPLTLCNNECVDLQSSTTNCGRCGGQCASGICNSGTCADVVPGQLVVVGHDFQVADQVVPKMQRLVGDALFLAVGSPVRVLVYRGKATDGSVAGVAAAFNFVVSQDGRSWIQTDAVAARVSEQLRDVDAFVIEAQADATDEELTALGQQWGLSMSQFLLRGGVILLFETPSAKNTGTYKLLEPAGLFAAESRESISRQILHVVTPGFGIAHVVVDYMCGTSTVHFVDVQSPGSTVVEDDEDEAVVIHRIVSN